MKIRCYEKCIENQSSGMVADNTQKAGGSVGRVMLHKCAEHLVCLAQRCQRFWTTHPNIPYLGSHLSIGSTMLICHVYFKTYKNRNFIGYIFSEPYLEFYLLIIKVIILVRTM
jgi:hypothetical protein